MKTRLLHGALALCLLLSMGFGWSVPASAGGAGESYRLWVGGMEVTGDNCGRIAEALAETGAAVSGAASFDPESGVLTLDSFQLSGSGYVTSYRFHNGFTYGVEAMIYTLDPIQIDLYGNNIITMTTNNAERFLAGINARADLRIIGYNGASLTVRSGNPASGAGANIYHTIGIQARDEAYAAEGFKNLEISGDCEIMAYGGDDGSDSYSYHSRTIGIQGGNVTLRDGCRVTAEAGRSIRDYYYCAVGLSATALSVSGGAVLTAQGDQSAMTMESLEYSVGSTGTANTDVDGVTGDALPLEQWPSQFTQNDDPAYRYAQIRSGGGGGGGGGGPYVPPSQTPLITAVNVSCAGGYEVTNSSVSGFYQSVDDFPEEIAGAVQESERMDWFKFRFMTSGCRLLEGEDTPTPIYLRSSGVPTTHELILYGQEKLDPSMFTITSGAQQMEDFTGGHYGDGEGVLYWYRTVIEIPAESNYIVVMYQQQRAVFLDAIRVSGISATYITQIRNAGMEEDENGNITSFIVEAAGFNLPTDPAAYSMEGCTLRSLSGPDETGFLTFVFGHDDPAEVIHWKDLLIYDKMPFYFDQYKVEEDDGFRNYHCNNDVENGAWASLPTPYYTLKRGGSLEEQSAPVVIADADHNLLYCGIAVYRDAAQVLCASYDGNGSMTKVDSLQSGTPLVLGADGNAAEARLMVLNNALAPQCAARTVKIAA